MFHLTPPLAESHLALSCAPGGTNENRLCAGSTEAAGVRVGSRWRKRRNLMETDHPANETRTQPAVRAGLARQSLALRHLVLAGRRHSVLLFPMWAVVIRCADCISPREDCQGWLPEPLHCRRASEPRP